MVWHTQGSGKSFSMLFFAARVLRHTAMQNPTLVVLADRNDLDDLDDQHLGQFAAGSDKKADEPERSGDSQPQAARRANEVRLFYAPQ